jgi:hypothetical protein
VLYPTLTTVIICITFVFALLGDQPRLLSMLGKCPPTELSSPQLLRILLCSLLFPFILSRELFWVARVFIFKIFSGYVCYPYFFRSSGWFYRTEGEKLDFIFSGNFMLALLMLPFYIIYYMFS